MLEEFSSFLSAGEDAAGAELVGVDVDGAGAPESEQPDKNEQVIAAAKRTAAIFFRTKITS